jgi:serine-type D-Ala-D-Ala endopeptidase (penicillin-binding protein 7)
VAAKTSIHRRQRSSGQDFIGIRLGLGGILMVALAATAAAQTTEAGKSPPPTRQVAAPQSKAPAANPQQRPPQRSAQQQPQQRSAQQQPQQRNAQQQAPRPGQARPQPARAAGNPQNRPRPVQANANRAAPAAKAVTDASVTRRVSLGQAIGLHLVDDPLDLKSSVALVVDQATGEALYEKNQRAVLPIASITKVMTAIVVLDAGLPLDEVLTITDADRDTERFSSSRLAVGSRLTRAEMLHLALMSSENRAAHALGRHYPGGLSAFIGAMNRKAAELQMSATHFADPTGLSGRNVSNAHDLAILVRAAYDYTDIRRYSTALNANVTPGPKRTVSFRTTNRLVDAPEWDIGLQKTGYISEAGRCLVMQAKVDGRAVIIVLLDAAGSSYRMADAQRLRNWLRGQPRSASVDASFDDDEEDSQG